MRNDADFAAYLAARWPFLVRSLVLIGCPRSEAEDVAQTGLARCYGSWDRVREADDVDAYVYRTVLEGWRRRRRPHDPVPEVLVEEETDEVLLRREIEAELGALSLVDREVLVLRFVAELTQAQVADALDRHVDTVPTRFSEQDFRRARETIDVSPLPYDGVVGRARELRRRRRRISVGASAAAVLVVAGLAWASTRTPAGPEEDQPDVTTARNPVEQSWYGDGRLQLRNVAVEVPAVSQLVEVGGGVVYADDDGDVVHVGPDGFVTTIGSTDGTPLVASDERSWVAWVTPGDEPELVLHDPVDRREVARIGVPAGARPVALDQNRVFFLSEGRTRAWEPLTDRVEDLDDRILLDVESATRVYGDGARIDMVQPFFNVNFVRPGATAELSPGGTYVLARRPGEPGTFQPLVYDARSGERLPTGVSPEETVLDAAFGPDDSIDFLVEQSDDPGIAVLRTCTVGTAECADVVPLPRGEAEPRLPH